MKKKKIKQIKKTLKRVWSYIISDRIIALISLIVSILTLCLGYKAYNKFLVDNVKTEQLELVIKLVEVIQDDEIKLTWYGDRIGFMGAGPAQQIGNVYSISTWNEFNIEYDIYVPGNFSWELKSDEYLFNPLVPKKIAKSLYRLRTDLKPRWDVEVDTMRVLIALGKSPDSSYSYLGNMPHGRMQLGMRKYMGGMKGLVANAQNVRNSIIEYFKKNGIESINPLIFDKANSLYPYNQSKYDRIKRQYNFTNEQTDLYFKIERKIRRKSDSLFDVGMDSTQRRKIMNQFTRSEYEVLFDNKLSR